MYEMQIYYLFFIDCALFCMFKGRFRGFAIHGCKDTANSVPDSGTWKIFKVKWGLI